MSAYEIIGLVLAIVGAIASVWFVYERLFPVRRLPWRAAEKAAARIADQMRKGAFDPTLIIGIGRGGAITGALISGCLGHRRLLVIDREYMWMDGRRLDDMVLHLQLPPALIERVLLVAGEAHSGNTMRLYHDYFVRIGAGQVQRAAFFVQKGCTEPIEYAGVESTRNLRLPWMFSKNYVRDSRSEKEAEALGHALSSPSAAGAGVKTFFIVRHGESTDNEGGDSYSGITDCTLTEEGLRQAKCVGRSLQTEGIQMIFCSPMKRAVGTARVIQALTGGELVIDHRLREIDYGEWEGLTRKEVYKKWPEAYEKYKQNPVVNVPPAGESPIRVKERVFAFWQEAQSSPSMRAISNVVIVTHNAVARILLASVLELPLERYRERRVDNASVSKVIVNAMGKAGVVYENRTEHLVQ